MSLFALLHGDEHDTDGDDNDGYDERKLLLN